MAQGQIDLKARVDAFRRLCEQAIADGRYTPQCKPGDWWNLWERIEDVLGIRGNHP